MKVSHYVSGILVLFVSKFCLPLEFLVSAFNQEECRKKWLQTEKELLEVAAQIEKAQQTKAKLELQNQHVHVLLKEEIRARIRIQEEKKHLVPIIYL